MVRKVFIDGGANNGCSIIKFINHYPDSHEYEIFSFEVNDIGCGKYIKKIIDTYKEYKITYIPKAIWIHNNGVRILNDLEGTGDNNIFVKNLSKTVCADSIDFADWIMKNFNKEDYLILKLDIEGSEYNVIKEMYKKNTLEYINEIHGELHGIKKGFNICDDLKLLYRLKKYNLDLFIWDAIENNTNDIKKEKYDIKVIVEMYKKWEKRKYITKVDWIGYDKYLKDENYIIKDL